MCLTLIGTIAVGIASYRYEPFRLAHWPVPPRPLVFSAFLLTLQVVFLSHWLLRPIVSRLFAEPPGYRTKRNEEGRLIVTFLDKPKEPLLYAGIVEG